MDGEDIFKDLDVNLLEKACGYGISEAESISDEYL